MIGMTIKLLMCGNDRVFCGMLLTVLSITEYNKDKIDLYIGTMDLTATDERYRPITESHASVLRGILRRANPASTVRIVDFTASFCRELADSKNLGSAYTPYAMIRLFAEEIEGIGDKLLYLDTDVMANGNIRELYSINVDDYHVAGARDYFGKFFFSPRYLNSGVLLINMKRMKEDGVFKKCRVLCRERKMLLFDQHAINKYAKKKLILSRRYNEQKRTDKNTLLRHFAMTIKWLPYFHTETVKPWQPDLVHKKLNDHTFDKIFERYERIVAALDAAQSP